VAEGRPLLARNPNGADGIGVLLRVMMDAERAAAMHGATLGLAPMSAGSCAASECTGGRWTQRRRRIAAACEVGASEIEDRGRAA
jgi:hypothetical protein